MSLLYILLAILLLGILITVHEFGHFIAARLTGIAVKEFSIGFGPKLLRWRSKKHETLFTLRPIPMGGYCMFYGDTDDDPKGEKKDDPRNYANAPVWKRMLSVLCGPVMNFVLAFVVAIALVAAYGYVPTRPLVDSVQADMPAQAAGLRAGDLFVSVNGADVSGGDLAAVVDAIASAPNDAPFPLVVLRDGEELTVSLRKKLDPETQTPLVGVTIRAYGRVPAERVIPEAWNACVNASGAILDALGRLVTTGEGFEDTAGPVGVVQLVAEQTAQGGLEIFLNLMVIISINLGLVNLFPIPGLDGSRVVFLAIEAIRRKPVSQRVEASIHMCGYALLLGLMLFFTFKDVGRMFGA